MAFNFDEFTWPTGNTNNTSQAPHSFPAASPSTGGPSSAHLVATSVPQVSTPPKITAERQLIFGEDAQFNPVPHTSPGDWDELAVCLPDKEGRELWLNKEALSKHLLLLGGIGSGKTNVFNYIISDLLERQKPNDIIFIFDTKGDFEKRFYEPNNRDHILIGNSPKYAGSTWYWNVFGELEEADGSFKREGEFAAKEIGKELFEGRGSDHQPFFGLAAADLVSKVIIDFERRAEMTGDRSKLNNAELVDWLSRADLGAYTDLVTRNPDFASAQLYFGDPGQGAKQKLTAQALGVFAYINLMKNDLLHGIFAAHDSRREFSMRKLVRNRGRYGARKVVFVEYDIQTGEVLGPMYRLLFDLALKEALGASRDHEGNVVFVIDEFKLLPNLMHIDDALNFGRSLGVKVFAGLQSIDQIMDVYGEDRGRAMLSGFMNAFCFQASDHNTRQYVSERFGQNVYQLVYRSDSEYQSVQREGHAVESWDVRGFPPGTAAIDLVGKPPFIYRFERYD